MLPGRLSVCRTFGDLEAKISAVGGNPQVVIAIPEIRSFRLEPDECDFIVIASDGIFDKLSNEEVAECVWMTVKDSENNIGTPEQMNVH